MAGSLLDVPRAAARYQDLHHFVRENGSEWMRATETWESRPRGVLVVEMGPTRSADRTDQLDKVVPGGMRKRVGNERDFLEPHDASHQTAKRNIIVLNATVYFVFLPEQLEQALQVQANGQPVLMKRVCPLCLSEMYDAPARYQTSLRSKHTICPECEDEQAEGNL